MNIYRTTILGLLVLAAVTMLLRRKVARNLSLAAGILWLAVFGLVVSSSASCWTHEAYNRSRPRHDNRMKTDVKSLRAFAPLIRDPGTNRNQRSNPL